MATEDEIKNAQERLQIHRANLAHYLRQKALFGAAYAPPIINHGIKEARDSIFRLKELLRSWNVPVVDHPDDNDVEAIDRQVEDQQSVNNQENTHQTSAKSLEEFDRKLLRQILVEYFSSEELFDLLFDMNIDYENLPGTTKSGKVRELIMHVQRHRRYSELVNRVRELRPDLALWTEQ